MRRHRKQENTLESTIKSVFSAAKVGTFLLSFCFASCAVAYKAI